MSYHVQRAPVISVNDEEVTLKAWSRPEGEFIKRGEILCEVETAKSIAEVEAEADGYLFPLVGPDQGIKVGGALAVISKTRELDKKGLRLSPDSGSAAEGADGQKRWTKKAAITASRLGINIEDVSAAGVVQEADVLNHAKKGLGRKKEISDLVEDVYSDSLRERVLIIGGGRGAVQVIDAIIRGGRQKAVAVLDDNPSMHGKQMFGIPVSGPISAVYELWERRAFDAAVITLSNDIEKRTALYEEMAARSVRFTNVIDATSLMHLNVEMGTGNVILPGCRVGPCSSVGNNNFMSSFVSIEHHNIVGSGCTFGPGVMTSSRVSIGDKVKFGTGIFIEPGVKIGEKSVISSGSILTSDVPECSIVKSLVSQKVQKR